MHLKHSSKTYSNVFRTLKSGAHSKLHSVRASLPKMDTNKLFHKICFHKARQKLPTPLAAAISICWVTSGTLKFYKVYCLIWGLGGAPNRPFIFCLCCLHPHTVQYKNLTALEVLPVSSSISLSLVNSAPKKLLLEKKKKKSYCLE